MILKLHVVHGRPAGKVLQFRLGDYFLGRGPECHIRFKSEWVSRQHCLLRVQEDGAWLRDLASRNGTLVNGRLCEGERRLADGDLLQVGPLVFKVRLESGGDEEEAFLPDCLPTLQPDGDQLATEEPQGSTAHYPEFREPGSEK